MANLPPDRDRATREEAAEYQRLVQDEGTFQRTKRLTAWAPRAVDYAQSAERIERLEELHERLPHSQDPSTAVERWITRNPIPLTGAIVDHVRSKMHERGANAVVVLQIGDMRTRGRYIPLEAHQLTAEGRIIISVPDSVAEEFRQQGRRDLKRELAAALGYKVEF